MRGHEAGMVFLIPENELQVNGRAIGFARDVTHGCRREIQGIIYRDELEKSCFLSEPLQTIP